MERKMNRFLMFIIIGCLLILSCKSRDAFSNIKSKSDSTQKKILIIIYPLQYETSYREAIDNHPFMVSMDIQIRSFLERVNKRVFSDVVFVYSFDESSGYVPMSKANSMAVINTVLFSNKDHYKRDPMLNWSSNMIDFVYNQIIKQFTDYHFCVVGFSQGYPTMDYASFVDVKTTIINFTEENKLKKTKERYDKFIKYHKLRQFEVVYISYSPQNPTLEDSVVLNSTFKAADNCLK